MKSRCFNPNNAKYYAYGARGIYVCAGWKDDFAKFLADMGPRPSRGHSIDRRNNAGSYTCGTCPQCIERGEPANCRWATQTEQIRNRSVTTLITLNGETHDTSTWAEKTGIKVGTILYRHHAGYPPEKVLSTEPLPSTRFVKGDRRDGNARRKAIPEAA